MQNVVELQGIVKRFGGQLANDGVDFDLRQGEVHALLGENGAGKTTLMRVLYGLYRADAGKIIIRGQETSMASPRDAIKLGIGMVHQQFMLVPTLTVAENIVLGMTMPREPLLDLRGAEERIRAVSASHGLEVDPRGIVSELSVGVQQRVEIAKALYREAEIIILDEPTSVLTPQEAEQLFRIIRSLCQAGKSVVFISHKLDEVMEISDRVTVLRDGRRVGVSEAAGTNPSELATLMVGREVDLKLAHRSLLVGERVLVLDHLGVNASDGRPLLSDVSLQVCAGEILGVAGVAGNGQTELAEVVTGLRRANQGRILVCEKDMTRGNPRTFIEGGVAHIPEDRDTRGLALGASLAENLVLGRHPRPPFTRHGVYSPSAVSGEARRLLRKFDVRPPEPGLRAAALSGGNRQKVVLARELAKDPRLLIAVQPTRGLDVMATSYVRQILLEQRESGKGILLISTELDEIMALSDRVAVLFGGRLMGIVPIAEATPERVGLMMAGSLPAPLPVGGA